VVLHGDPGGSPAWGTALLRTARLVVAADGASVTALTWGRTPDVVVGDLDSLGAAQRAALEAAGSAFEIYPRAKDQTDGEIALRAALARGARSIRIAGALGGARLDHALANVLLLTLPELQGLDVTLVDERHEVRLLRGPSSLSLAGAPGDIVTLLPLTQRASGITTRGLRYALRDGTLLGGRSRGVSNELTGKRASITLARGQLLVVLHRVVQP
jgi:thiamine pyrophosphokinase